MSSIHFINLNQKGGMAMNRNPMWDKNRVPISEKKEMKKQITPDNINNELNRREIRKCEKCDDSTYYQIHRNKCDKCMNNNNLSEEVKNKITINSQTFYKIDGVDPKDYDKKHFEWYQKEYGEDPNVFVLDKKWQDVKKQHENS